MYQAVIHTATGSVVKYGYVNFNGKYDPVTQSLVNLNDGTYIPDSVPIYYCKIVSGDFAEMNSTEKEAVDAAGLSPAASQTSQDVLDYLGEDPLVTDSYTGIKAPWDTATILILSRELYNASDNPYYLSSDFTPILGASGWAEDHANRINNLETIVGKNGWLRQEITRSLFKGPAKLLIYYGWVNSFNYGTNSWNNELVAQDIAQYDLIVLGDGLETLYDSGTHNGSDNTSTLTDTTKSWTTNEHVGKMVRNTTDGSYGSITANTATTITATLSGGTDNDWDSGDSYEIRHADYNSVATVIARIRTIKPAAKVFGYVAINQTQALFEAKVDEWETLQTHGIFMDNAGYDYGTTRSTFNDRVDYVHGQTYASLCFVNSWNMDHIIGTTNDPSYPNSTYNVSADESNLTYNDWYLLESFPINTTAYSGANGYESKTDWAARGSKAIAHRYTYGINLAAAGIINNNNTAGQDLFDFGYVSTLIWSLEAYGTSDTSYGSGSATVKQWELPDIGRLAEIWNLSAAVVVDNGDSDVYWRFVKFGKLKLDFSSSAQLSAISHDSRRFPDSESNPTSNLVQDGDRYYNTTMGLEMQYDAVRGKWLSINGATYAMGHNGSTPAGSYYNGIDGITQSSSRGYTSLFDGTVVAFSYSRGETDSATFEIVSEGAAVAEVSSTAVKGVANNLDGDFNQNEVLALRNKSGSNTTTYVTGWIHVRWRA